MLGDWTCDRIPGKNGFTYRFVLDIEDGPDKYHIDELAQWFFARGYCAYPVPTLIIRKVSANSRVNAKERRIWRLTLFTYSSFGWIYNAFYIDNPKNKGKIKVVPSLVSDYMIPLSLADWIMQDGSRQHGQGVMIAANSLTHAECVFLANLLRTNFNLATSVISAGVPYQYKISIWKESMPLLRSLVNTFMIGDCKRKIALFIQSLTSLTMQPILGNR
jgi:hypothetical protein